MRPCRALLCRRREEIKGRREGGGEGRKKRKEKLSGMHSFS
jgi:hypothetical protein